MTQWLIDTAAQERCCLEMAFSISQSRAQRDALGIPAQDNVCNMDTTDSEMGTATTDIEMRVAIMEIEMKIARIDMLTSLSAICGDE